MIEEFNKYLDSYDLNDVDIKLKRDHSLRVMELSKKYATLLNYGDEDIELAALIGLLHDIGRFKQLKEYHSYDDTKTIDHADMGVKILFSDGLIERFTDKNYDIIYNAIKYHNKLNIDDIKDERTRMFAGLIRDVDKIDILYLLGTLEEKKPHKVNDQISPDMIKAIEQHQVVDKSCQHNYNDFLALRFAFPYDINNDICLPEIKNNLEAYYQTVGPRFAYQNECAMNYIDERMKNNVRNKVRS